MKLKDTTPALARGRISRFSAVFILAAFCYVSTTCALEVMTWIPPYGISNCKTVLNATWGDTCAPRFTITIIAIQWYNGTMSGGITMNSGPSAADVTWVKDYCKTNKIKLLMCITNWNPSWDWNLSVACYKTNQAAFINNIMNTVETNGYDGVDMDFEGSGNDNQADFAVFVKALATRLHAVGKILSIDSFPYIWNNPNVNWWKDWVGYCDFINGMQYQGGENDPNIYYKWTWRQDQGTKVGYKASQIMLSFPGWMDTWSGGSMGTDLLSYIKESQTAPKEPGPISVWDCQFQAAGWRTAAAWQALHKVKLTNRTTTAVASSNPAAPEKAAVRMSARAAGNNLALALAQDGVIDVRLYDGQGRLVRAIYKGFMNKGTSYLPFAKNELAAGSYVVGMTSQSGHCNSMIGIQ